MNQDNNQAVAPDFPVSEEKRRHPFLRFLALLLAVLMILHRLDKIGGVHETLVRPGIQPGESLTEQFYIEFTLF